MKKGLLYLLMIALAGFSFASCSDDEKDDSLASKVAGTYTGTFDIQVQESPIPYAGTELIITRTADDRVSLMLEDFEYGSIQFDTLEVTNVTVSRVIEGGVTYYALTGISLPIDLSSGGFENGTVGVTGEALDHECRVTLTISVPMDPVPMSIIVGFESEGLHDLLDRLGLGAE